MDLFCSVIKNSKSVVVLKKSPSGLQRGSKSTNKMGDNVGDNVDTVNWILTLDEKMKNSAFENFIFCKFNGEHAQEWKNIFSEDEYLKDRISKLCDDSMDGYYIFIEEFTHDPKFFAFCEQLLTKNEEFANEIEYNIYETMADGMADQTCTSEYQYQMLVNKLS